MASVFVAWAVSAIVVVAVAAALGRSLGRGILGIAIDTRGRYSLSQLQLAVWSVGVIPLIAGVFVGRLLDDPATAFDFDIPGELLAVLGISIGSGVGALVIKNDKNDRRPDAVAATDANARPRFRQVFLIEEGDHADRLIDIAKFQNFWFTALAVAGYVALAIAELADLDDVSELESLPNFDPGLVALIGISHAGYLAAKLPDRSGEPNAPSAVPLASRRAALARNPNALI